MEKIKTSKQMLEILGMFQLCVATIPFICGFIFTIMKMGWLSGIQASKDLIDYYSAK